MRKLLAVLGTAMLGLLPAGCLPLPAGSYFKPSYDGKGGKAVSRECGGTVGRKEVLKVNGPVSSKLVISLSVNEGSPAKLVGLLSVHAKVGTRLTMLADSMEVIVSGPTGGSSFVRLHDLDSTTVFTRGLEGRRPWGSEAMLEFTVPSDFFPSMPKQVVVQLPPLTVTETLGPESRFEPGRITFTHRSRDWYISPLNC